MPTLVPVEHDPYVAEPIDPVMDAWQRAAPELGPSASGRAVATPSDQAMIGAIASTNMRTVPGIVQTALAAMRQHLGVYAQPKAPVDVYPPVQTGLPMQLQPAPPATLAPIVPSAPPVMNALAGEPFNPRPMVAAPRPAKRNALADIPAESRATLAEAMRIESERAGADMPDWTQVINPQVGHILHGRR